MRVLNENQFQFHPLPHLLSTALPSPSANSALDLFLPRPLPTFRVAILLSPLLLPCKPLPRALEFFMGLWSWPLGPSQRITKDYTQINFCLESTHSAEGGGKWGPSPVSEVPGAELETAPTWAQAGMMISWVPAPPPPNFSVTGHVHLVNIALSLPRCCFKTITSTNIRRCHHD